MSLRSFGYLLTRRLYPRKIYSMQAGFLPGIVSQAASVPAGGRPGRSLHSLRDLSAGVKNAYGPLFAAALAGGLGILIFKKYPDGSDNNVTNKGTKEGRSNKLEVKDNKPVQVEVTNMEKRDMDIEVRFDECKKEMGRVYPNQEEETRRFELFKESVNVMDSEFAGNPSAPYLPTLFADMTIEEVLERLGTKNRSLEVYEQEQAQIQAALRLVEKICMEEMEKEKEKEKGASTAAKRQ